MEGSIRIGVGGWTFPPWRGPFYPKGLAHNRELEFASRRLTSIEINGTFYRSQAPETFAKWHDETPAGFVFAVKAPRYATNRRELASAGESIERFVEGGLLKLKDKLGPVNWQLPPTRKLDLDDVERFLKLLPQAVAGRPMRHAIEVRHASFRAPEFLALAREHAVAVVVAGDSEYSQIADLTAPFVYARIMGTSAEEPAGYSPAALRLWAERARAWAQGRAAEGLELVTDAAPAGAHDVFVYVISGHKERNPAAAVALIERLDDAG